MKLALGLDLYRGASMEVPVDQVRRAEDLGYHSVWTAEAYGSDAFSPLAYLAAFTTRIRLGTDIAQIAARTPAATAMQAMTIDSIAGGGRVIIGLGVSGPQIVEGWYGQPWGNPNQRLREYVAIMRKVFAREPLTNDGSEFPLPYRGPGGVGQGKPLRSILHLAGDIGIWLGAGGPKNTALAAEVCDGFLPMGWGPEGPDVYGPHLDAGFAARGGRPEAFDIFGGVSVVLTDDVRGTLDAMKPLTAMYVGGMGSATHNYHREAMARRGFPDAAARIHELWMAGEKHAAVAAVPDEYLEQGTLLGSVDRIRSAWEPWTRRGLTGVIVRTAGTEGLELLADLVGSRDTVMEDR